MCFDRKYYYNDDEITDFRMASVKTRNDLYDEFFLSVTTEKKHTHIYH